jgi:hypothetical protein
MSSFLLHPTDIHFKRDRIAKCDIVMCVLCAVFFMRLSLDDREIAVGFSVREELPQTVSGTRPFPHALSTAEHLPGDKETGQKVTAYRRLVPL